MYISKGGAEKTTLLRRSELASGEKITAPALVMDDHCAILVERGFTAHAGADGSVVMKTVEDANLRMDDGGDKRADPVTLEVFNHAFMSVAEQMGETLVKTAHSVNMKERLDFSCAVFDPAGNLIANAPHIPLHLGAMGESVKALIREAGAKLAPCDVSILSERRVYAPFGVSGGENGAPGVNTLIRDGRERVLSGKERLALRPGDVLRIETPGGGGFGEA